MIQQGIFHYPVDQYPFRQSIEAALVRDKLEAIDPVIELLTRQTDQHTIFHQNFYAAFASIVEPLYKKFIQGYVKDMIGEAFVYQKVPTFRIQLPNNIATAEFHRDTVSVSAKKRFVIGDYWTECPA